MTTYTDIETTNVIKVTSDLIIPQVWDNGHHKVKLISYISQMKTVYTAQAWQLLVHMFSSLKSCLQRSSPVTEEAKAEQASKPKEDDTV